MREEPTWITHEQAAEILGSHRSLVGKLIDRGLLRPLRTGGYHPSINRAEVEALARARAEEAAGRASRRRDPVKRMRPPDNEHEWLSTSQAAKVMGVNTPQAVVNRCNRGQLPCAWFSGRRWIRRDQLEMAMRVWAAQKARDVET